MRFKHKLITDDTLFSPSQRNEVYSLTLGDCLDQQILICPDTKRKLKERQGDMLLADQTIRYPIKNGSPMLYPKEILDIQQDDGLPLQLYETPLQQYCLLSQIKQSGEINANLESIAARKHQFRFKSFCDGLKGLILDVGSDKPSHSTQFLPSECQYIGLDPYAGHGEFRLIGLGEMLPVRDSSMNAVLFNTSLDHILDYHTAIEEAHRVLKPAGQIIIATYAWIEKATLLSDAVHFDHFREFQILGALEEHFTVEDVKRYECPKNDTHRYGLFVRAQRRNS